MNANPKIKAAMKANEREVLKRTREANRKGEGWRPFLIGMAWHNALDRLKDAGKIKWRNAPIESYHKTGWWTTE